MTFVLGQSHNCHRFICHTHLFQLRYAEMPMTLKSLRWWSLWLASVSQQKMHLPFTPLQLPLSGSGRCSRTPATEDERKKESKRHSQTMQTQESSEKKNMREKKRVTLSTVINLFSLHNIRNTQPPLAMSVKGCMLFCNLTKWFTKSTFQVVYLTVCLCC